MSRDDPEWEPPPHNPEAEQVVLGAMMVSPSTTEDVLAILRGSGDFYRPAHQLIYEAVTDLHARGDPHDAIAVKDHLDAAGLLAKVGGAPYLHTLLAGVPTAANAGWYAGKVRARAVDRNIIETGTRLTQVGWERGGDADWELADKLEAAYRTLDEAAGLASPPRALPVAELLPATLDRVEAGQAAQGIAWPWEDLNALTAGMHPGQFIIVASRPTVGKSTILLNAAVEAALAGVPTLVATLEMPRHECLTRMLSSASQVPYVRLRDGRLEDEHWDRLKEVASELADAPLLINDEGYQTTRTIRADMRRMKRDGTPCGLLVVDYLQLLTGAGATRTKEEEISGISRDLKLICKGSPADEPVPALVAVQLNRGPEYRAGHRPLLSELRGSGALEQDCDVAILLHREGAYERESPRAGEIDLIVAKHRQGETATITAAFQGWCATVADMAWSPSDQAVD